MKPFNELTIEEKANCTDEDLIRYVDNELQRQGVAVVAKPNTVIIPEITSNLEYVALGIGSRAVKANKLAVVKAFIEDNTTGLVYSTIGKKSVYLISDDPKVYIDNAIVLTKEEKVNFEVKYSKQLAKYKEANRYQNEYETYLKAFDGILREYQSEILDIQLKMEMYKNLLSTFVNKYVLNQEITPSTFYIAREYFLTAYGNNELLTAAEDQVTFFIGALEELGWYQLYVNWFANVESFKIEDIAPENYHYLVNKEAYQSKYFTTSGLFATATTPAIDSVDAVGELVDDASVYDGEVKRNDDLDMGKELAPYPLE